MPTAAAAAVAAAAAATGMQAAAVGRASALAALSKAAESRAGLRGPAKALPPTLGLAIGPLLAAVSALVRQAVTCRRGD